MKKIFLPLALTIMLIGCNKKKFMIQEYENFKTRYDSIVQPLSKDMNLAWWEAATTGKDSAYARAQELQMKMVAYLSDKNEFETIKKIRESSILTDSIQQRELDVIYLSFLSNQADTALLNQIIGMQTEIEKKFSTFRADVDGKKLSDNDIEHVLTQSTNPNELEKTWLAHKKIGSLVGNDILQLVKKRNELAHSLGFGNFHEMSLELSEQNPVDIEKLFDELDSLTKEAYTEQKNEIDLFLSKRFNIPATDLMPWHYQNRFFQEAPKIYDIKFDQYYQEQNIELITKNYYNSIGISIDDILQRSDLYERDGKNQHAFCIDIDNSGDIRVLCNLKPNHQWMNTMLHEYGHAAYDKYIDSALPFSLRNPAHIFTTEAIAMLFGRLASNPQWIQDNLNISTEEKNKIAQEAYNSLKLEQLVFSRWAQVVYRFEKNMYANPDQDLNELWWSLVEKYQQVKKPLLRNEPDWASKIHIATAPCYYHNYLLGEIFASQLHYHIANKILKSDDIHLISYSNSKETGQFLIEQVFKPGAKYKWNILVKNATGEPLTSKYYALQFVN